MRLFELDDTKPMATAIVAISDQLKSDLDRNKIDTKDYTLDKLLSYFYRYGIILSRENIKEMMQDGILKGVVDNIQGDKVVFTGHKEEKPTTEPEKADKVVKDMAKKAMKKNK